MDAYQAAAYEYKTALKQAKDSFFARTLPSMLINNLKQFWDVVRKTDTSTINLKTLGDDVIPREMCADVLNDVFTAAFTNSLNIACPHFPTSDFLLMDPIIFDPVGIKKLIEQLKLSSSCGVDNINSKLLKNTQVYSAIILSKLFQQSLGSGCVPNDWKVGKVIIPRLAQVWG